jgi:phage terminase large subunit-like protein
VYQEGVGIIRPDENGNLPERPDGKWVMVILDVEFGKWSQTEIANRIAKMNDKWRPKRWYGEDLGGLQTFKEKIIEVSKTTYGHWPYIPWVTPDNNENSKRNRIKGVEILLRASRLYFLIAPWNVDVFEQLENYKGQKSTRYSKDDVPDVISLLTKFIPSLVPLSKREMEQVAIQRETEYKELLRREIKKVVFGDDGGGFGVNNINRIWTEVESPKEDTNRGPMADISRKFFGGNGMRA